MITITKSFSFATRLKPRPSKDETITKSFSFATRLKPRPSKDETITKSFSVMPTGYPAADGKDLGAFVAKRSAVTEIVTQGYFVEKGGVV